MIGPMMRRHAVCALMVALSYSRAGAAELECRWINLLSAVTIATAAGEPISGAWS